MMLSMKILHWNRVSFSDSGCWINELVICIYDYDINEQTCFQNIASMKITTTVRHFWCTFHCNKVSPGKTLMVVQITDVLSRTQMTVFSLTFTRDKLSYMSWRFFMKYFYWISNLFGFAYPNFKLSVYW